MDICSRISSILLSLLVGGYSFLEIPQNERGVESRTCILLGWTFGMNGKETVDQTSEHQNGVSGD